MQLCIRSLLLFLVFSTTAGWAQGNAYQADLAFLKTTLQRTPSYKAQIRGDRRKAYEALYRRLAADSVAAPLSYRYFDNLSQLLRPLRDNHLGLRQVFAFGNFRGKASIDSFMRTPTFRAYPASYPIHTDSLKAALAQSPPDSLEGIYHYSNLFSIGLFRTGPGTYTGVVVDSRTPQWQSGQIAARLHEFAPNLYKAIYSHPVYKILLFVPVERFTNQSLINSGFYTGRYRKDSAATDSCNLPAGTPLFALKNLDQNIQYVRLRSFQTQSATARKSRAFYDSIRHVLTAPYLLVDLRNNQGGAPREARKYVRLLRTYSRRGKLYLLINNETVSQAERFVLRLAGRNHVTTVGQTTKGMLSYGSNYGQWRRLPSGTVEVYPTDLKGRARFLRYEDYGIVPDMTLRPDMDWINQVVEEIRQGR